MPARFGVVASLFLSVIAVAISVFALSQSRMGTVPAVDSQSWTVVPVAAWTPEASTGGEDCGNGIDDDGDVDIDCDDGDCVGSARCHAGELTVDPGHAVFIKCRAGGQSLWGVALHRSVGQSDRTLLGFMQGNWSMWQPPSTSVVHYSVTAYYYDGVAWQSDVFVDDREGYNTYRFSNSFDEHRSDIVLEVRVVPSS